MFELSGTSTSFWIDILGTRIGGLFSNTVQALFEPGALVGIDTGVGERYAGSVMVAVFTKDVAVGEPTTPNNVTTTGHTLS
jgi:hypothetical protein